MTQIFVFTAANPDAQRHLKDTIKIPIDEEKVFGKFFWPGQREELEGIREEGGGFYAWGAVPGERNTPNWKAMRSGDYVLCAFGNAYHYAARVLGKYANRRFAEEVWGTTPEGETWELMYFLTKPVAVDRRVPEVAEYLNAGYRGFARINDAKVDAILLEFGSVDAFIDRALNGPEGGTGTAGGSAFVTDRDMEELEDAERLDREAVDREAAIIRNKLAYPPNLREGLDPQTTQTSSRPRSAAFEIGVKKAYGYRCAVCGSGLRSPNGKPEVHSAHIFPKSQDGSEDIRNGLCLCRRHHWAMDVGWFAIADDHTVLVRDGLPEDDDYGFIGRHAGESIRLPSEEQHAPHPLFLEEHRKLMDFG